MPEFEIFVGDDEQHYWRLKAANGEIIAVGGEGFDSHSGAVKAMGTAKRAVLEVVGERAESADAAAAEEGAPA